MSWNIRFASSWINSESIIKIIFYCLTTVTFKIEISAWSINFIVTYNIILWSYRRVPVWPLLIYFVFKWRANTLWPLFFNSGKEIIVQQYKVGCSTLEDIWSMFVVSSKQILINMKYGVFVRVCGGRGYLSICFCPWSFLLSAISKQMYVCLDPYIPLHLSLDLLVFVHSVLLSYWYDCWLI